MQGRAARLTLGLLFAVVSAACDPAPRPSDAGPTVPLAAESQSVAVPDDCAQRLRALDLTKPDTVYAVDACRYTTEGLVAARALLEGGGTRDQVWGGVWVYDSAGDDPGPLALVLTNADPSIRVMAAASLFRLGDRSALEVLGASLSADGFLAGSLPPRSIAQFARRTLARYVIGSGIAAPADFDDEPAAADAWRAWLAQHQAALVFDAEMGGWSAP